MSLDKQQLEDDLIIFLTDTGKETKLIGATDLATVYESFALTGKDVSGDYVNTYNKSGFITIYANMPDLLIMTETQFKQIFFDAFIAFWTSSTFETFIPAIGMVSETSSVVNSLPTKIYTDTQLIPLFAGDMKTRTVAQAASILATVFDNCTKQVGVLITGLDGQGSPVYASGTLT